MVRWLKRGAVALLVLALALVGTGWWALRGSLPRLDGELALPGLSAPVSVQRDALGVVTIDATNPADAMRALGYVHGQERFFEMDLMRRTAAGELAGLFGARAIDLDKTRRVHRMRARVERDLAQISGDQMAELQAYVEGVNAGVEALPVRPWQYLLLRTRPQRWQLSDTPLAGYAMYFDLHDATNARELALWKVKPHVPPALFALLSHDGSGWDAPLVGTSRGDAPLPDASQLDLRKLPLGTTAGTVEPPEAKGSNNFAVAGSLTRDGRAIVADDMHLTLRAPNIWFRARLRYPDPLAAGGKVDATGFTLPGLPVVVVGSNGYVAWGFTNGYGDWLDWRYQPPCKGATSGCEQPVTHRETMQVAGGAPVAFDVQETAWGPVMERTPDGGTLSLRWTAHLSGSINLGLGHFMRAGSLDDALRMAEDTAIPGQNLVMGDRNGRIAWRMLGPIPQRDGGCSTHHLVETALPPTLVRTGAAAAADGSTEAAGIGMGANAATGTPSCQPWAISTANAPRVVDPPSGRIWTANARVVDGEPLERIGDGGYVLGSRALQIRDGLFAREQFSERDLLAIQLDDRALLLQRWWQLLGDSARRAGTPALNALAQADPSWEGVASTDSVSYRITRAWRVAVHKRISDGLLAHANAALGDNTPMPALPQLEGVAWPLVSQRPPHLLPATFASWDTLLEDAAREVRDELRKSGPLAARSWGERNIAQICHPLAGALPAFLKPRLCMPFEPLPGDTAMPRVQTPDMGASQRMVVAPGHEADGITHMPGGQSGHPLSPFWGAGHADWVHGRPTPFLPGATQHAMTLVPAAN